MGVSTTRPIKDVSCAVTVHCDRGGCNTPAKVRVDLADGTRTYLCLEDYGRLTHETPDGVFVLEILIGEQRL